jgi:hypothetical protein
MMYQHVDAHGAKDKSAIPTLGIVRRLELAQPDGFAAIL